jgi:hypothetical protein
LIAPSFASAPLFAKKTRSRPEQIGEQYSPDAATVRCKTQDKRWMTIFFA